MTLEVKNLPAYLRLCPLRTSGRLYLEKSAAEFSDTVMDMERIETRLMIALDSVYKSVAEPTRWPVTSSSQPRSFYLLQLLQSQTAACHDISLPLL